MDEIDSYVGSRVRQRREVLGISQRQLAKALGTSYQQLQKYERGRNRIPASRLFALTSILNVSATYFFGYQNQEAGPAATPAEVGSQLGSQVGSQVSSQAAEPPDSRLLAQAFLRLRSKALRRSVIAFVEAVADQEQWPVS